MDEVVIRPAASADLEAINAIYTYCVLRSTCTWQNNPDTLAERQAWFGHHGPEHPVIVAERAGQVVGWGSLSPFREREGYCHTVENSVYVHQDALRRGIGGALLKELIEPAQKIGHHTIIAAIDGEQDASLALHAKHGFVEVGRWREVGVKFNRWLDVVFMQLMLGRDCSPQSR
jgi:phosphinothricin acetyltransferase